MKISETDIDMILKGLKNCIFEELSEDNFYDQVIKLADKEVFDMEKWAFGATKIVLFPHRKDFVVKIPLEGEFKNGDFFLFEGAAEPEGWNYCEVEKILFAKAKKENFSQFFLQTEYIGGIHGYPIYIQEVVGNTLAEIKLNDHNLSLIESKKRQQRNYKIRKMCKKRMISCFNATWIADFIDYYTEETFFKLGNFLEENWISDLHSGNIGYSVTGAPVIIDYASYND